MDGMTTDQPQRIINAIRELYGRQWPSVLANVISDLMITAGFSPADLLDYLCVEVSE